MQTLVGLMCWFAANVTRSPCFARLTASASAPTPSRSGDPNSASASARSAARLPRASRRWVERPDRQAHQLAPPSADRSVKPAPDGERDVVPAEPEAVAERELDVARRRRGSACSPGRSRVGVNWLIVGGMIPLADASEHTTNSNAPARAEHVPGHRLGGADVHGFACSPNTALIARVSLKSSPVRRRRAVCVDVAHIVGGRCRRPSARAAWRAARLRRRARAAVM